MDQSALPLDPKSSQPPNAGRPANHLRDAVSPYLLQHAHNPVDWYPWGPEALERSRRENKPIFLSIGYAACHWCHVMEREVFENPALAELQNACFVNIKVDREERPDLDELYMLATQLMTGSGGWPMSVWLTPELEPFYAGTYFPPTDALGRPGFGRLCQALADSWRTREVEMRQQAAKVVAAVKQYVDETVVGQDRGVTAGDMELKTLLAKAIEAYADRFDPEHGGLGSAPKFPPSQALNLWVELLRPEHGELLTARQRSQVQNMLTTTLDHMMRGGIFDQLAGGFARYSVDGQWLVPHFEKMLYDNAQLALAYAQAAAVLGRPDYARIARRTLDFFLQEMVPTATPQGGGQRGQVFGSGLHWWGGGGSGFSASLDADSEGREGTYYVWTIPQVQAALAEAPLPDVQRLIRHYGLTVSGNFESHDREAGGAEGGRNVLAIDASADALAGGAGADDVQPRLDDLSRKMRESRAQRPPPARDDKILTGWNGLMISALAVAGRLLREPRYLEAAHGTAAYLLRHHMSAAEARGGGCDLLRMSRIVPTPVGTADGGVGTPHGRVLVQGLGFLEDHAYLLNGLMDLVDSTVPTSLPGSMARKYAQELADGMIRRFADAEHGGFYATGPRHEQLFARLKNASDAAVPSANGVAIQALLRLARASGKDDYQQQAGRAVRAFGGALAGQPSMFATILQALVEDSRLRHSAASRVMREETKKSVRDLMGWVEPVSGIVQLHIMAPDGSILAEDGEGVLNVVAGGVLEIPLRLEIAPGFHIAGHQPTDREAYATVARVRGEMPLESLEWEYPPLTSPPPAAVSPGWEGYAGTVVVRGRVRITPQAVPGNYQLRITVLAQPCEAGSCRAPERVTRTICVAVGESNTLA